MNTVLGDTLVMKSEEMPNNALVSIIVPVYHAKEYIEKTIRSVEAQTFHDWELILVDDCGGDGSLERIREIKEASPYGAQIRIVQNEKNLGAAMSRNHGVEKALGRYIAFLDADDCWLPTKLEEQLLFMRQKGVGFSFTSYEFGDENAAATGRVVHVPHKLDFRHALSRTVIFTSTVIFDTKIVPKAQIRMPDMPSEDTALWWTILKTGVCAYGMDRALTIYRRPASSLSSNKKSSVKRLWNLLIRVAGCGKIAAFYHLIGWAFHATMRRIANGVMKYVVNNPRPFIVQCKFHNEPQDSDKPLSTITSVGSHMLVAPNLIQYHSEQTEDVRGQQIQKPLVIKRVEVFA